MPKVSTIVLRSESATILLTTHHAVADRTLSLKEADIWSKIDEEGRITRACVLSWAELQT